MRARPIPRLALLVALLVALVAAAATGCTAASDNDGDWAFSGRLAAPPAKADDAVPVVVDSDLAPDDLVALAYLLRNPRVRVLAVTVPTTGLVTCPVGLDLLADLTVAARVPPVPVACGTTPRGPHGKPFPAAWSQAATTDSGLEPDASSASVPMTTPLPAHRLLGQLARRNPGLQVVALGPLTELAAVLRDDPVAYADIASILAMTGVVEGDSQQDGVGEWNAAADPDALAAVLAGPVPVTVVPHEVVPLGPPEGKRAPVVGAIGTLTAFPTPRFWDLATAGFFTAPFSGTTTAGSWTVDLSDDLGRLTWVGVGDDDVVTSLDPAALDSAYAEVFVAE